MTIKMSDIKSYFQSNATLSCFFLLLPTILIFFFLLHHGYPFKFDADWNLQAMAGYQQNGIENQEKPYVGYRAYLFPYFYSLFPIDLSKSISFLGTILSTFSVLAVCVFLLVEFIVLKTLWKMPLFFVFYIAVFINPLVLAYVPYPLQENFLVLLFSLFIPMIYASYVKGSGILLMISLGVFFGAMYMTRASEVLLLFPVLMIACYFLYQKDIGHKSLLFSSLLFSSLLFSSLLIIAPQSIVMHKAFGTWNAYPKTSVLTSQFRWGDAYAKYGTNLSGSTIVEVGQPYWNPLSCTSVKPKNAWNERTFICSIHNSNQVKNLSASFEHNSLQELLFKSSVHLFNALNYDYLKVYTTNKSPNLFSWHQILSMCIVFLGFFWILRKYINRTASAFDIFLDGILIVTLGVCLFFGVETRFGLLATMVLSIKAVELTMYYRPHRGEAVAVMFGLLMFVCTTSLLSIYVLSLSGALSR